ncbi:uncharacterized protein LOC142009182 [Carettochelys insculpta]|uniref:uncharacterized protein LOC142009182 n=1 Tax=Carettochelys insculpta TaxID=44489 RepID=UPI003EBC8362
MEESAPRDCARAAPLHPAPRAAEASNPQSPPANGAAARLHNAGRGRRGPPQEQGAEPQGLPRCPDVLGCPQLFLPPGPRHRAGARWRPSPTVSPAGGTARPLRCAALGKGASRSAGAKRATPVSLRPRSTWAPARRWLRHAPSASLPGSCAAGTASSFRTPPASLPPRPPAGCLFRKEGACTHSGPASQPLSSTGASAAPAGRSAQTAGQGAWWTSPCGAPPQHPCPAKAEAWRAVSSPAEPELGPARQRAPRPRHGSPATPRQGILRGRGPPSGHGGHCRSPAPRVGTPRSRSPPGPLCRAAFAPPTPGEPTPAERSLELPVLGPARDG